MPLSALPGGGPGERCWSEQLPVLCRFHSANTGPTFWTVPQAAWKLRLWVKSSGGGADSPSVALLWWVGGGAKSEMREHSDSSGEGWVRCKLRRQGLTYLRSDLLAQSSESSGGPHPPITPKSYTHHSISQHICF